MAVFRVEKNSGLRITILLGIIMRGLFVWQFILSGILFLLYLFFHNLSLQQKMR